MGYILSMTAASYYELRLLNVYHERCGHNWTSILTLYQDCFFKENRCLPLFSMCIYILIGTQIGDTTMNIHDSRSCDRFNVQLPWLAPKSPITFRLICAGYMKIPGAYFIWGNYLKWHQVCGIVSKLHLHRLRLTLTCLEMVKYYIQQKIQIFRFRSLHQC